MNLERFRFTSRLMVDGLRSRISAIFLKLSPSAKSCCRYFRSSGVKCVYDSMSTSVLCWLVATFYTPVFTLSFFFGRCCTSYCNLSSSLLTQGRAYASGIYSEKTGKTYDAFIVLEDDGARSSYKLDFTK